MADATILIVEDEEKMRRLFDLVLRPEGYHLLQADSGEAALKLLEEGGVDLVLTDLQMAKVSGLEVLEHVTKDYPELPVVIITGYGTVKSAVEAVKKGAFDYISKPVDNDELKIVVRRALEMRRLTQEHRGLSQELRARFDFDNIVGRSVELAKVKALAKDLAVTDSTVLISGERGTDQELRDLVQKGKFREDLFYRVSVCQLHLPPLRERRGDIPVLLEHFLAQYRRERGTRITGLTPSAMQVVEAYPWPGNIRELQNMVEWVTITCKGDHVDVNDLPAYLKAGPQSTTSVPAHRTTERPSLLSYGLSFEEVEKAMLQEALEQAKGNVSEAARLLKVTRNTLRYRMGKYHLKASEGPE